MMKMEKNFIAVNDKGYTRQPYDEYPIYDADWYNEGNGIQIRTKPESLLGFIQREMKELEFITEWTFGRCSNPFIDPENPIKVLHEIADVSNTLDYLYEAVFKILVEEEKPK